MAGMRSTVRSILQRRDAKTSTFLITGGTGFIGSHLATALLKAGFPVVLVARRRGSLSARERVRALLDWFELDEVLESRLTVLEGNLDQQDLGLSEQAYANLLEVVDEIVHCASDTSFSERKRPEIEKANVANLDRLLDFSAKSRCCFFHHVSTAYVAGKTSGVCPEDPVKQEEFTNVYEETKCIAEAKVSARCAQEGIRLNVYRPSITYGDSSTGKTLLFNGFYYPVKTVVFLKNIYEKDLNENEGRRARQMGVRRNGDGGLFLPLRVATAASSGVNLIPIDYLVKAFMAILSESLCGDFFHVVNSRVTTLEELAEFTRRFFGIEGILPVSEEAFQETRRNALEALFEHYIEAYGPYMKDKRIFDSSKTRAILEKRQIVCPEFDFNVFSRCMEYAETAEWGTNLFGKSR